MCAAKSNTGGAYRVFETYYTDFLTWNDSMTDFAPDNDYVENDLFKGNVCFQMFTL